MTRKHVIKCDYEDGKKLNPAKSWCGFDVWNHDWCFTDAQHALLAIESEAMQQPCIDCIKSICKTAEGYLKSENITVTDHRQEVLNADGVTVLYNNICQFAQADDDTKEQK